MKAYRYASSFYQRIEQLTRGYAVDVVPVVKPATVAESLASNG